MYISFHYYLHEFSNSEIEVGSGLKFLIQLARQKQFSLPTENKQGLSKISNFARL